LKTSPKYTERIMFMNKNIKNFALPFTCEPDYEDKLDCLTEDDFFDFFEAMNAAPQWATCGGKPCIKVLTLCHGGTHHNAAFDPETHKITCFSECNKTMMLHTWVGRALGIDKAYKAKQFIEKWIAGADIDLSDAVPGASGGISCYHAFDPDKRVEMVPGIDPEILSDLYSQFDTSPEILSKLGWAKPREQGGDGIPLRQLIDFQVAYYPARKTIILPHHNINGEIVGLYERNFMPTRDEMRKYFGYGPREWVDDFKAWEEIQSSPRSKYMPLLKEGKYQDKEKPCWSFPNSRNLYGLHKAKEAIKESGKAIIFEGAKSVMLAHAYGYPFAVASHTYGASENHLAMLIQAGAKEIILAFDKQYQKPEGKEWDTYQERTEGLAKRVGACVTVSRICDRDGEFLGYKDAPIDKGKAAFDSLFERREILTGRG